jgi:hypothetical protein
MGTESATRASAKQAKQPAKDIFLAAASPHRFSPQREFATRGGTAVPKSFASIPALASQEISSAQRNSTLPLAHSSVRLPLQRKLAIGSVNDPLESEADAMADQVMRAQPAPAVRSNASPAVRRNVLVKALANPVKHARKKEK